MFRILSFLLSLARRTFLPGLAVVFLTAGRGLAADGFDPHTDNNVYAMVVQSDGKIVVGGNFTTVQSSGEASPASRNRIARFNVDGTLDTSFTPNFNADITAMAVQTDGKIVVGGNFTSVTSGGDGTTYARCGLVRLNKDGSLDTSFQADTSGPLNGQVFALALQSDGKILAGGAFTAIKTTGASAAATRYRVARINADGTLDDTFAPLFNNIVYAIALYADGRIVFGGGFTKIKLPGQTEYFERKRLARFASDGTFDYSFDPRPDNRVMALAVQNNNALLVGGDFLRMHPASDLVYSTERNYLARIHENGTLDGDFNPSASACVDAIVQQTDGKILVGGLFTLFRPYSGTTTVSQLRLARLNFDGSIDTSYAPQVNAQVSALVLQSDGRLLVGGYFDKILPSGGSSYRSHKHIARLETDGTLDAAFVPETAGHVACLARQSDGSVIVGGNLASLAGVTCYGVARLKSDGALDPTFRPIVNGIVYAAVIQSDGKIVIGGSFTTIDYTERHYLARLNTDGSLDTGYDPKPNATVQTLVQQSDGKLLVGGGFLSFQPNGDSDTTDRSYIARLNTDGTVDDDFYPTADNTVYAIAIQSDGKIVLGGAFTSLQPNGATSAVACYRVARINADGTLDNVFDPFPNASVYAIAIQSDGKIVIGGAFYNIEAEGNDLDDDNDVANTVERNHIARLNTDGSIDTGYDPDANDAVATLALESDGHLVVGGSFTSIGGHLRARLALLETGGSAVDSFDIRANEQVSTILVQTDGSLLVGGNFTVVQPADGAALAVDSHLVRIAATGTLDTTYLPHVDSSTLSGVAESIVYQTDGRVLVGGLFDYLAGSSSHNLVRYNADGSLDSSFLTGTDGEVSAILSVSDPMQDSLCRRFAWLKANGSLLSSFSVDATSQLIGQVEAVVVQSDGKVVLGGAFTDRAGIVTSNLCRFNADGTRDTTFLPDISNAVSAMALDSSGRLIVVGSFTSINTVARCYIARFNTDGSLDTSFNPCANGEINSLLIEPDGRMLVAGAFSSFQPNSASSETARNHIARLNADGTLDTAFNPNAGSLVNAIARQPDGRIILGGSFTTLQPNGATSATDRYYIARINADGALDTSFYPTANAAVTEIAIQSDGHIILGGSFSAFKPNGADSYTTRYYAARLNYDGTLDNNFVPSPNGTVNCVALDAADNIYLGGDFTTIGTGLNIYTRNHIARLDGVGALDHSFNPNSNDIVRVIVPRTDGTVLVGGDFSALRPNPAVVIGGAFSSVGPTLVSNLARLNADGNVDASFIPGMNSTVYALVQQSDRSFIAGGSFTTAGGTTHRGLARFASDGTIDTTYAPDVVGEIASMALLANNRLLVGGAFTKINATARASLAILGTDGVLDTSFNPGANGRVKALVVQGDGRYLVGGEFTTVAGVSRAYLARLNTDGSLDTTFLPVVDGSVSSIALQANGSMIVGGNFTSVNGTTCQRLARLGASGTLDTTFAAVANDEVLAVTIQPDGRPLLGGRFTTVNSVPHYLITRLPPVGSPTQTVVVGSDLTTITWIRSGIAPEFSQVCVSLSTDEASWTDIGYAQRTGTTGAWQLKLTSALPTGLYYYLRTRGAVASTMGSSFGLEQAFWQFSASTLAGYNPSASSDDTVTALAKAAAAGTLTVTSVSVSTTTTTSGGTAASSSGVQTVVTAVDNRLASLSARASLGTDETLVAGFVVGSGASKRVLVRAVGPGLASLGVADTVAAPQLQLFDSSGLVVASNAGWGGTAALAATFTELGAFPLSADSADAALVATLAPGAYTLHVRDGQGVGGIVLAEIYDADTSSSSPRLVNLSARAISGSGSRVLIGGFVISGTGTKSVLLRGIGPTLASLGLSGFLTDPVLRVYNAEGSLVAQNDNWESSLASITASAGAFALPAGSSDAALALQLGPGAYTVEVAGSDTTQGQAMFEIYESP